MDRFDASYDEDDDMFINTMYDYYRNELLQLDFVYLLARHVILNINRE